MQSRGKFYRLRTSTYIFMRDRCGDNSDICNRDFTYFLKRYYVGRENYIIWSLNFFLFSEFSRNINWIKCIVNRIVFVEEKDLVDKIDDKDFSKTVYSN